MFSKVNVAQLIILTGLYFLLAGLPVIAQVPQEAPLKPTVNSDMPPGRGFIPPPMDLSYLTGHNMPAKFNAVQAPTSWDWRTQSDVTSVKNQGSCGACYSFASLGNFEAKMLIDGAGTFDFSENNAKECHYQENSCGGGNYYEVASLFSQKGTVLESCDPYVAADVTCNSSCEYQKTLLDWRIICGPSIPSTALLQDYIYNYGPVYTTLYAGDANEPSWSSEFNAYDGSYAMYHVSSRPVNHAVLIVGWDDNIVHAGGTGAWIVKNSWGTGWGGTCGYGTESGYFMIAYGSANIGMYSSYLYDWQDYDSNGEVLYHDEGGWTGSYGYSGLTTAWGLCKFVPTQDININRVEFWTNDATADIDIYLYDDFNGVSTSNLLATKLNQSFSEAGYHSVVLDAPVEITSGNDVYAVVKFTNQSEYYPVVIDDGYSATATTYLSSNGASGSWYDMSSAGKDVAIRLRGTYPLAQSVDDDDVLAPFSFSLSENYPNPFNPKTTIKYSLQVRTSVSIVVYNLLGQEIRTLVDEIKPAGSYETGWDGTDADGNEMATGVYFYQIRADDFAETKKMLLLK